MTPRGWLALSILVAQRLIMITGRPSEQTPTTSDAA
jgi:hypothetical protein